MEAVTIYFSKLRPEAVIPSKREEDAGYDIYACLETDYVRFGPGETRALPTGIASACPAAYYFHIAERGSTGGRGIAKRSGIIDSGYRGEWFILLTNLNPVPLYFVRPEAEAELRAALGDAQAVFHVTSKAFCQALLLPVPKTQVQELCYSELCAIASERGDGAWGSSRK